MLTRRQMLGLLAAAASSTALAPVCFAATRPRKGLGVGMHSYGAHWLAGKQGDPKARFNDPVTFLEYCHEIGAGGVQVGIGARDSDYTKKLRSRVESLSMYLEGQTSLPASESDLERFESEVYSAKESGANIMRVAMLSGRRYETFDSMARFEEFADKSWRSLTLAEPIMKKHKVRLAIENHKDWRIGELIDLIKKISSEYVGILVDIGNSIALLEDPMGVVEAYAPWAVSTHVKDMAAREYDDGFLLSEVPLGQGFLELGKMFQILERANPKIHWNLEMMTRDPLKIPCLTEKYWTVLPEVSGAQLARTLRMVRDKRSVKDLPTITGLNFEEKLTAEDQNVRLSIEYANILRGDARPSDLQTQD